MSFNPKSLRLGWLSATSILLLLAAVSSGYAQVFPDLEVQVSDTSGYPGKQSSVISVYLKNYADTVAGFELWLMLDRPDRIVFQTHRDTIIDTTFLKCSKYNGSTCIDTVIASWYWVCTHKVGNLCTDSTYQLGHYRCNTYHLPDSACLDSTWIPGYDWFHVDTTYPYRGTIDTTGTLVSGWEYIQSRSLGGSGHDLKISAFSNQAAPPYHKGIGFPQYGDIPLIKLMADIYTIPDSTTERTVKIMVQADNLDNFNFSDQAGNLIGVITAQVPDTSWFHCQAWADSAHHTCLFWEKIMGPPADSIHIDTVPRSILDTTKITITDGSLTILRGLCGDVNNNGAINILDITFLINYLYKHGAPPPNPFLADCNGKAGLNVLDVTYLINFIYKHGPAPVCQ